MVQLLAHNFEDASLSFQAALDVASQHPEVLEDGEAAIALMYAEANLEVCGVGAFGAPPLAAVAAMVDTARQAHDWPGMLWWESRLEELLLVTVEATHPELISGFAGANFFEGHYEKAASLFQRSVQVLGKMERFAEQGGDMCRVGDCFLRLNDVRCAETWFQNARKLGETHGCYVVECAACLGLGRAELCIRERMQEAEDLLRHALSVLDFVGDDKGDTLERDINTDLSKVLLQTDRYEEAGPLIQRLRELAERASADPFEKVAALDFAVRCEVRRGDVEQAWKEMQVLPSDPISYPPRARFTDSGPRLSPPPHAPTQWQTQP